MRKCLTQALGIDDGLRSGDRGNWLSERQTACGLDASVIETFPTFRYSTVKTLRIGKAALECPVCLNGFEDDETLRLIPHCCHVFHTCCIDAWLRSHVTCPFCRANLVPVPGNKSMPRKSMSTGWKLAGLFSRLSSTGQMRENLDRFTLRLPQEIHDQLANQESKGHIALPQVRSSIRGSPFDPLVTGKNNVGDASQGEESFGGSDRESMEQGRAEATIRRNQENPGDKPAKKMKRNHPFPETKAGEDSVERTTASQSQKPEPSGIKTGRIR
ncbi:hypothetical protein HID58_075635 [Brassica napus]|uniref:RING-type E3 ubiquitin transferase n=1 Tax=Brassica napus TaxID=3708 RepID=A0ABQ7YKI1_BRANA|nr:hypothetical protein HID58_075635 [Brassica napus]